MARNMRTHGKNTIVWLLMGMLVLGLGGFGLTNFSGGGSSAIGSVGQTEVPAQSYARALRGQINAMAQQGGARPTMAQLTQMGLDRSVQAQLFAQAAYEESARDMGVSVGDTEMRQQILSIDAFKGLDGQFDRTVYADALKREGLSEGEFETQLRAEAAAGLIEASVTGAVAAPQAMTNSYTAWLTETRDLSWVELSPADLKAPLPAPTEDELTNFHKAHAELYTIPETRRITYVALTPEAMADQVKLDEDSLRKLYEERITDYQRPERRMVEVLVYPDAEAAAEARARLDAEEVSFADLAAERGLTLADIDRGEVTEPELGAAGPEVFAATDTGVVGPVTTDLGPALVSVNALLEASEVSFEEARADLAAEATADQARRSILSMVPDLEDRLAGGATIEDMANETAMVQGNLSLTTASNDGMAGYPAFRKAALTVTENDFPTLFELEDGGVAALRLDGIDAPFLKPLDEVRSEVNANWASAEIIRRLAARAVEVAAEVEAGNSLVDQGFIVTTRTALERDDLTDAIPPAVVTEGFALSMAGEAADVAAEDRVFIVQADAIHEGGESADADLVRDALRQRLSQSLASDIYAFYARAVQDEAGLQLNPAVVNAVNAQVN